LERRGHDSSCLASSVIAGGDLAAGFVELGLNFVGQFEMIFDIILEPGTRNASGIRFALQPKNGPRKRLQARITSSNPAVLLSQNHFLRRQSVLDPTRIRQLQGFLETEPVE